MVGKLKVIFLTLVVMSMAAGAQADSVFPFAVGYTASYSAHQGSQNTWTSTLSITGATNINGQPGWIMQMSNWDGDNQTHSMGVYLTPDTFSMNGPSGLQPYFKELPASQSWELINFQGYATTATVEAITTVEVPAGTFNNVYKVYFQATNQNEYQYFKPGVGLIKDEDLTQGSSTYGTNRELTSYATPLPPSVLLLGSGLLGLAGWRRFRKG